MKNKFQEYIVSNEVRDILTRYKKDNYSILMAILTGYKQFAADDILKLREIHKKKLIQKIDNGEYDDGMKELLHIKEIIGDMLEARSKEVDNF